ncbi:glycoside hydrolase family 5 protein [Mangrovibacterium diazotrophicum]|uniref:Cellulase (Glycosyl hydrolase family 5) n=1 Tax=Mangrovibacterium diazotrophicum TaxID=1261403 RepID=A0A419W4F8_9BACT|nr:cellulase family glycosylhydrolase [Mangrovibacterium diazotrophicum]RKD90338.1 cellulase (glycosyl hydrolase family 5) [Mangrovibacterium diazotrophicum]
MKEIRLIVLLLLTACLSVLNTQAGVNPKVIDDSKTPSMLHVEGRYLVNAEGEKVWLQGVSLASMEWLANGENILQSTNVAIHTWKVNCLRCPVNEDFWFGKGKEQTDGGASYRKLLDDFVKEATSQGVYVVIDLHRFKAPKQIHADFWKEVASIYKNHPGVFFELFNEPHDISWEVWKNGGLVTNEKRATDALAENNKKYEDFESVGMQALIDAVRSTGAQNIVIVGGLDWSYDLSGYFDGYALDDRNGNGIMLSTHVYPWKSDWKNKFMMAIDTYPLFLGELGAEPERMPFIPPERHEMPETWVPDMLGLIQKYELNWTAWCFHPRSTPRLILDWDYTPTPFWGQDVLEVLRDGKQYQLTKLR